MRAKTVNEDQNFKRGQDPKISMGIGITIREKNILETLREIYCDHERDFEDYDPDEYDRFVENEEYYPIEYSREESIKDNVEEGFNNIIEFPFLADKVIKDNLEELGFNGIEIESNDLIRVWWGDKEE